MAKAYIFLANGFEDVEALGTVDILRRGGVDVKTVSINDDTAVTSSHGVTIYADITFNRAGLDNADMLILPGGMPGATNLNAHKGVCDALLNQNERGGKIAAICAAPMVLGGLGLLNGRRATCYPGFEKYLDGAEYTGELFVTDGNITTGEGPAATFPFAYELLTTLTDEANAHDVAGSMMYLHLMGSNK